MIFVTGASGLVGSHLIKSLLAKDKQVVAFYRQTIPSFEGAEKVNWILGDILDVVSLTKAMQGVTQVYHCAAIVSFAPKIITGFTIATFNPSAIPRHTSISAKYLVFPYSLLLVSEVQFMVSSMGVPTRMRPNAATELT